MPIETSNQDKAAMLRADQKNLTNDMVQALFDMERNGIRGPGNTGLSTGTYQALQRRGLAWPKSWRKWKISAAGQDALSLHK